MVFTISKEIIQDCITPYMCLRSFIALNMTCKYFANLQQLDISELVAIPLVTNNPNWYHKFSPRLQLLPSIVKTFLYQRPESLLETQLLEPKNYLSFASLIFRVTALAKVRLADFAPFATKVHEALSEASSRHSNAFDLTALKLALPALSDEDKSSTAPFKEPNYQDFLNSLGTLQTQRNNEVAVYEQPLLGEVFTIPTVSFLNYRADFKEVDRILKQYSEHSLIPHEKYVNDFELMRLMCHFWPIEYYGQEFSGAAKQMLSNETDAIKWISQQGFLIYFAPEDIQNNAKVVRAALSHRPIWYLFFTDTMQCDSQTIASIDVPPSVEKNKLALIEYFKNSMQLISPACRQFPHVLDHFHGPETRLYPFLIERIRQNPHKPYRNYPGLLDQREAVVTLAETLSQWPQSSQLRKTVCDITYTFVEEDIPLLKRLAQLTPGILKQADPKISLFNDHEYLLDLAKTSPYIIIGLPQALQENHLFLQKLIKANPQARDSLQYLPPKVLRSNPKIRALLPQKK